MSDGEGARDKDGDRGCVEGRPCTLVTADNAATLPKEISASEGRDRASATTLSDPERCRISVVNSEMKERCLVCLGDLSAEEVMAPHSGL